MMCVSKFVVMQEMIFFGVKVNAQNIDEVIEFLEKKLNSN